MTSQIEKQQNLDYDTALPWSADKDVKQGYILLSLFATPNSTK
jgi:hypothetical protein